MNALRHTYNFYGGLISQPGSVFLSVYGLADLLADQMDFGFESSPTPSNLGRWYCAAYFQDDWKATPHLTLKYGLRYDFFGLPTERLTIRRSSTAPVR